MKTELRTRKPFSELCRFVSFAQNLYNENGGRSVALASAGSTKHCTKLHSACCLTNASNESSLSVEEWESERESAVLVWSAWSVKCVNRGNKWGACLWLVVSKQFRCRCNNLCLCCNLSYWQFMANKLIMTFNISVTKHTYNFQIKKHTFVCICSCICIFIHNGFLKMRFS